MFKKFEVSGNNQVKASVARGIRCEDWQQGRASAAAAASAAFALGQGGAALPTRPR
jgi:hypothetical protein